MPAEGPPVARGRSPSLTRGRAPEHPAPFKYRRPSSRLMDAAAAWSCERNMQRALRKRREFEQAKAKKASAATDDAMDIDTPVSKPVLPSFTKLAIGAGAEVVSTAPAVSSSSAPPLSGNAPTPNPGANLFGVTLKPASSAQPSGSVIAETGNGQHEEIDPAMVPLPEATDDELMEPPEETDNELEEEQSVKDGKKKAT
ncbi:hypothetical protein K438DRAFT_1775061 [Mycena galopus ATCC 62051]|nr:hypothetical protein K438DRAFT_1775061 [Mycena galopus ATCC 62051]